MDPPPVPLAVAGASGRMGRAVAAVVEADARAVLAGRLGRPDGPDLDDRDAVLGRTRVVVDFSTPAAAVDLARAAAARVGAGAEAGSAFPALVVGVTGFDPAQEAALAEAARRVPVLRSGNFSLGVNLLLGLVARAARALPAADWDVEVFEAHHRRKLDAPSGTALMLGEAAASGRGARLSDLLRPGPGGPRPPGAIGVSAMRGGGIVGEHRVVFAAEDEVVELSHSALDRGVFARGAVEAALWLAAPGRAPGLYDMADVLSLKAG